MTRLFVFLYLGVLVVLFAAWYIYGQVSDRRREADRARVFEEAHGGGARLVARELDLAPASGREAVLEELGARFQYPIEVVSVSDLPKRLQAKLANGVDVSYANPPGREVVVAVLADGSEVVQLGPFPNYTRAAIEDSMAGWIRLTADKLRAVPRGERPPLLDQLRSQFYIPLDIVGGDELPTRARSRIVDNTGVVFYSIKGDSFVASPLAENAEFVRFGPFPHWDDIERPAATTTLALVLLPTAFAIALMLRPIATQLRRVENAAQAIAAGDLTARVDESRIGSARPLAQAFNQMANRTETLVRTQRELLQAVSHELRTPLSRMRFAIDLVDTAQDDSERRERLDAIDAAAEELDALVGELLRYVRLESAGLPLDRESVALRDVFETVIHKYNETHPNVELRIGTDVGSHQTILADRQGFMRVVSNLLSNASRFAKQKVTISATSTAEATTVDVDDDGEGIAVDDRERVFEPFVRLGTSSNGQASPDGFGLGLALVRRIVTQHGGTVDVLTSPLGGCRMRTVWPHADQTDDALHA